MTGWRLDFEAIATPAEDPYLVVGRLLREQYGPLDWRERIVRDPKIRATVAALAEDLRAAAKDLTRIGDGGDTNVAAT